jgi:hypothetical protein
MPKLIIPNAYELYQTGATNLTQDEINARYFYNLRFLWLLEAGDAILLPKPPAEDFLSYLAEIKNIDLATLNIVILENKHKSLHSAALLDINLITQLQNIITSPSEWEIQCCYFSKEIAELANQLHLTLSPEWRGLIESDFIRHANSKAEFRRMAISNHIPVPEGVICLTQQDLAESIQHLLKITGQVIIKQEYNASGKGNIGVGVNAKQKFVGVIKTFINNKYKSINQIAEEIFLTAINANNSLFVVEVYHPNKGSFTAQFRVPAQGQEPKLVNCSEILMESRWTGVQIPSLTLSIEQTNSLIGYSNQFSEIMQTGGYRGYLCCDAILTNDNKILFTEINVRPGAETHAYVLSELLFGKGYENDMMVLTRNGVRTDSFIEAYTKLKEENLLLSRENKMGIVILTVDDIYSKQLEYLIAAPDLLSIQTLEKVVNSIL